jgi:hypothetical protein
VDLAVGVPAADVDHKAVPVRRQPGCVAVKRHRETRAGSPGASYPCGRAHTTHTTEPRCAGNPHTAHLNISHTIARVRRPLLPPDPPDIRKVTEAIVRRGWTEGTRRDRRRERSSRVPESRAASAACGTNVRPLRLDGYPGGQPPPGLRGRAWIAGRATVAAAPSAGLGTLKRRASGSAASMELVTGVVIVRDLVTSWGGDGRCCL